MRFTQVLDLYCYEVMSDILLLSDNEEVTTIEDVRESTLCPSSPGMDDDAHARVEERIGRVEMEESCPRYAVDGEGQCSANGGNSSDTREGCSGIERFFNRTAQGSTSTGAARQDSSGDIGNLLEDVHSQRVSEKGSSGIGGTVSAVGTKVWNLFKRNLVSVDTDRSDMVSKLGSNFREFETAMADTGRTASVLDGINKRIEQRLEYYAKQCRHTNTDNLSQVRRILHDSIYFKAAGTESCIKDFTEFLERIVRSLQGLSWYAIGFHPETTRDWTPSAAESFAILNGINRWSCNGTSPYTGSVFSPARSQVCWTGDEYWRFNGHKLARQCGLTWKATEHSSISENAAVLASGHFHVVHGCSWYNHECRHLSKSFDVAERKRPAVKSSDISEDYFENIFKYIATKPRFLCHVKMSHPNGIHFVFGTESIQKVDLPTGTSTTEMASRNSPDQEGLFGNDGSSHEQPPKGTNRLNHGKRHKSSDDGEDRTKRILQFILEAPTFPLENILRTKLWDYSDYNTMIASDKIIQRCLFLAQNKFAKWTFKQFEQYYESTVKYPHWAVTDIDNIHEYYFSVDKSLEICECLIDFQLESCELLMDLDKTEKRSHFLNDLYDILEKQRPKVNCFMVLSEPSAGKNFFFDAICAWYINVGLVQNFNRYNNFPLMEAINRRINIWNEPNMEPAAFDTVKMLLAGDPLKAAVKYQGEQPLIKTPIIVMTNNECFPNTQAFNDRIVRYTWQRAPFLKHLTKKIHPEVWPRLVYKYVLVNDKV
ncbi:nonstructural protein [Bat-associated densovirus 5]|uniref:Nonstructural protein n=1 Tax=Bat-associated densovirus 5 TaxID=3070188 RepID=A0A7M1PWE5_9VIRU|nr:nonstructural protein [Bat associated densovirus]QOR29559.1 nonstructural protein [Bat-associated densovirus 5]